MSNNRQALSSNESLPVIDKKEERRKYLKYIVGETDNTRLKVYPNVNDTSSFIMCNSLSEVDSVIENNNFDGGCAISVIHYKPFRHECGLTEHSFKTISIKVEIGEKRNLKGIRFSTKEELDSYLHALQIPYPSVIVRTHNALYLHWLLEVPSLFDYETISEIKEAVYMLEEMIGGNGNQFIMGHFIIPYSETNNKTEIPQTEILFSDYLRKYKLKELRITHYNLIYWIYELSKRKK